MSVQPFIANNARQRLLNYTVSDDGFNLTKLNYNVLSAEATGANGVAAGRHSIMVSQSDKVVIKNQKRIKSPWRAATEQSKANIMAQKIGTKINSFGKRFRESPFMRDSGKNITSFLKKRKGGLIGAAGLVGASLLLGKLRRKGTEALNTNTGSASFYNRGYLPGSYKQGFNEIKELTTDFGSRVHLDKTTSKIMQSPVNSTRHGYKTSTSAMMRGHVSLANHANAIGHTRY